MERFLHSKPMWKENGQITMEDKTGSHSLTGTVFESLQEETYTVIYSLNTRENPRAKPEGFP